MPQHTFPTSEDWAIILFRKFIYLDQTENNQGLALTEAKIPDKKSDLVVKVIIRRSGFEIAAKGTIASLSTEINSIAEFADLVSEKLSREQIPTAEEEAEAETPVSHEEVEKIPTADIPAIKSSKSTMDNLSALFDTPWGRTPRTLAEVMKALEVNAIPDKVQVVNVYMTRLVQRGKLRRLEKEGKYVYFKLPE